MAVVGQRDNFSGDMEVTAPTGGYTAGLIYLIQGEYVVARDTIAAAATGIVSVINDQPILVTKIAATGETFTAGQQVYVNSSAQADPGSTGNTKIIGVIAHADAAATATSVWIRRGATA